MTNHLLPTTIVGSLPQPDWLIDREKLFGLSPPRIPMRDLWRVEEPFLQQAQDDATLLAIRAMERAGIDIITDGEMRRESYANRFTATLEGLDFSRPGTAPSRVGRPTPVPRVVGPIRRTHPVQLRDVQFLRTHTDRRIKTTLPGPFTLTKQVQNEYYSDERSLAMAFAAAVNQEIKDLQAAGADVVQIDEPLLQAWPAEAQAFAVEAINCALDGARATTALHTCFGYGHIAYDRPRGYPFLAELNGCTVQQISVEAAQPNLDPSVLQCLRGKAVILGVIDIVDATVETPQVVAARIRAALQFIPPERLIPSTDCGMKYLPREVAVRKLEALVQGSEMVRQELQGEGSPSPSGRGLG